MGSGVNLNIGNARFNQDGGYLGTNGNNHIRVYNGGFNLNGGRVYGTVDLTNSYFSTSVSNANGLVFNVLSGGSGTLYGNLSSGAEVYVYADAAGGSNFLYLDNNAVNNGFMKFIASGGYGININVGNNTGTLNNAGIINFHPDSTTFNSLYGSLQNTGSVFVNGYTIFNGNVNNNGFFAINKGGIAEIGTNSTFYQNGTLQIDGTLSLDQGGKNRPRPQLHAQYWWKLLLSGRAGRWCWLGCSSRRRGRVPGGAG